MWPTSIARTLAKGCPGDLGRHMLESKASPNPSLSVSHSVPSSARLQTLREELDSRTSYLLGGVLCLQRL